MAGRQSKLRPSVNVDAGGRLPESGNSSTVGSYDIKLMNKGKNHSVASSGMWIFLPVISIYCYRLLT
jgi:hypothetical protein